MRIVNEEIYSERFKWVKTCKRLPEQYDICEGNFIIACVRLRHGIIECTDTTMSNTIFICHYGQDETGEFENDKDRLRYLSVIEDCVESWRKPMMLCENSTERKE